MPEYEIRPNRPQDVPRPLVAPCIRGRAESVQTRPGKRYASPSAVSASAFFFSVQATVKIEIS
jgi:hypothetical protein